MPIINKIQIALLLIQGVCLFLGVMNNNDFLIMLGHICYGGVLTLMFVSIFTGGRE